MHYIFTYTCDTDLCLTANTPSNSKCSIELPDEYAELAFETRCCQLTATTKSGKTVSVEFRITPEDDDRGMSTKDLEAKFNNLTKAYLKPATRKQLLGLCWRVDKLKSVDEIVSLTGVTDQSFRNRG